MYPSLSPRQGPALELAHTATLARSRSQRVPCMCVCVSLSSYYVANLVVPSSTSAPTAIQPYREFAKEKDRVESRAVFLRDKEKQKLEREMDGYMNWICRAGESISAAADGRSPSTKETGLAGELSSSF